MSVIDLIVKFGKDNVINYLKDILILFIRPKKFFLSLFQKSTEDQLMQILFYILLDIGLGIIFFEKQTVYFVIKLTIFTVLHSLLAFLILYSSSVLCNKFFRMPLIYTGNIFILVLIMKIFYEPIYHLVKASFEATERYEIELVSNILIILIVFYVFINSQNIFYSRLKHKIVGSLIVLLIFNCLLILVNKLSFDESSKFSDEEIANLLDPINAEYDSAYNSLDTLKILDHTPYFIVGVFREGPISSSRLYYEFLEGDSDTILNASIDYFSKSRIQLELDSTSKLIAYSNKLIPIADSLSRKLKYKRNKKIFENVKEYLYMIKEDLQNPVNPKSYDKPVKSIYKYNIGPDSLKGIIIYKCNHNFSGKSLLILKALNKNSEAKHISTVPLIPLAIYTLPYTIITGKLKIREIWEFITDW